MCMRERGFKREDIVDAIQHCVPEAQADQGARNWQRYAERAVSYAFGVPGDVWLAQGEEVRKQEQQKREEEALLEDERRARERQADAERPVPQLRMR